MNLSQAKRLATRRKPSAIGEEMYITINRETCVFTHVAQDYQTLLNLCHIELSHVKAYILPVEDIKIDTHLTDLEMKLLYRNSVGEEYTGKSRSQLNSLVYEYVKTLPYTPWNRMEIELQASKIKEDNQGFYQYVQWLTTPYQVQELFEPVLTVIEDFPTVEIAMSAPYVPEPTITQVDKPMRTGGSKDTIFSVADTMWEAANKPTEQSAILALRKKIMQVLENDYAIKKTTSSNTLGLWQKARLN